MPDIRNLFARLFRFALSMTRNREMAEDIAQEAILRGIRKQIFDDPTGEQTQDSSEKVTESSRIAHWLIRVARNIWLDQLKSSNFQKRTKGELEEPVAPEAEPEIELKETVAQTMRMMNELPDTQRQVLYLHAVEEMSVAEIAEALDMTSNAVKSNLSLARKTMRRKSCQATALKG